VDPEAVADTIVGGPSDVGYLLGNVTMEKRERVIRAFVEGLTIDEVSQTGEVMLPPLCRRFRTSSGAISAAGESISARGRGAG
jgi:hypothetical protein